MKSSVQISTIFPTTLERAFKTPMLCDVTKIHTGYSVTPKVTHCTEDETWVKKVEPAKYSWQRPHLLKEEKLR